MGELERVIYLRRTYYPKRSPGGLLLVIGSDSIIEDLEANYEKGLIKLCDFRLRPGLQSSGVVKDSCDE